MILDDIGWTPPAKRMDWALLTATLALCGFGWLILYAAAGGTLRPNSDAVRQAAYMGVGLALYAAASLLDYRVLARLSIPLYLLNVAMLVLVVFLGHSSHGAQRWINLGPLGTFQPSEPAKLLLIVTLAALLAAHRASSTVTLLRALLHVLVPFGLILVQPDLGTAMILIAVTLAMLFIAGTSPVYLIGLLTAGLGAASFLLKEYQRDRLLVFLYPEADPMGMGYSLIQSRTAIGSGQLWGHGLFDGPMVSHHFVPEHTTDFIFANVGEELGLLGTIGTVLLFVILIGLCLRAALRARDRFGTLLCVGVAALLAAHAIVNIGMTIGMMPVAGVPLPMMSYGGSAMLTALAGLGLVSGVSRRS